MIRRTLVAAVTLTVLGGVAAPALAGTTASDSKSKGICVLGTNGSNGTRDGICVWIPTN